jgi:hypothetical protein
MCNRQHHDHLVLTAWGSLLNARPWPDADLEIAECPKCRSTLSRALTWTPIQTLGVALARVGHYIQFRKEAV